MATKKTNKVSAKAAEKTNKNLPVSTKTGKKELTKEEKAAKSAARKERMANMPEGQRQNSKQIDVIPVGKGSVEVYAMPVRKIGSLVTSIAINEKGEITSCSTTLVAGVRPKSKKGHGNLTFGAPGLGKKGKKSDAEDAEDEDDSDED